jgi:hypothetical protein
MKKQKLLEWWLSSGGSSGPALDTAANTNGSDQQVWWLIGDSLPQTAPSLEKGPEPAIANTVYEWNGTSIAAITTNDLTGTTNGSFAPKFGWDIYKRTSKKIVFCRSTVGGSEVHNNGDATDNWSTAGNLYGEAKTKLAAALAANTTTVPRAIIFSLGINDVRNVSTDTTEITAGFESLFSRLNTDFPDIPIFIWLPGMEGLTAAFVTTQKCLDTRAIIEAAIVPYPQMSVQVDLLDYKGTAQETFYDTDLLHLKQLGNDLLASTLVKDLLTQGLITDNPITYTYTDNAAANTVLGFTAFAGLNTEEKNAIYDLVSYMDGKTDWQRIDSFYSFMFNTQAKCNQDLRRSAKSLIPGALSTWTNKSGYRTGETTAHPLDPDFIPSTDGTALGYLATNNTVFVSVKTRHSAAPSVGLTKRSLFGAKGFSANRNIYISEDPATALRRYIVVNNCGNEVATTTSAGNPDGFDGNKIWGTRRSGAGSSTHIMFPASLVTSGEGQIGTPQGKIIIGGVNNNGTFEELIDVTVRGLMIANGSTIDYVRAVRKFREFNIDLYTWA